MAWKKYIQSQGDHDQLKINQINLNFEVDDQDDIENWTKSLNIFVENLIED